MHKMINTLRLAAALARQDMHDRFAGAMLGGLWIFIWPLVQMSIYICIFGQLMGARIVVDGHIPAYGIYVAAGLTAWTCFANTLLRCSRILVEKKHVIGKVALPLGVFPLSVCLTESLPFGLSVLLLCIVDLCMGWQPSLQGFVLLCLAFHTQQVWALALGLLCGVMAVFARDAAELASIGVQIWFWFTPVVYVLSILPEWVRMVLLFNPMLPIVQVFQNFFLGTAFSGWLPLGLTAALAHVALWAAWTFFKKLQSDIRDAL